MVLCREITPGISRKEGVRKVEGVKPGKLNTEYN